MPKPCARVRIEVDEAGRRAEPRVQVVRAEGGDLVRAGEIGRVHQDRRTDIDDRARRRDALAVDRDRLRAGSPQLLDDRAQVPRADEVVGLVRAGRDRFLRVLELEDDPGPGERDQPGRDARLLELVVELTDELGRPLAGLLGRLDLRCADRGSGP